MPITKDSIRLALTRVMHPGAGRDIVAAGAVKKIAYCDGYASVTIAGGGLHNDQLAGLRQQVNAAVRLHAQQANETLADVHVEVTDDRPTVSSSSKPPISTSSPTLSSPPGAQASRPAAPQTPTTNQSTPALPDVRHIIAVGAGKGGVGKSTVAVNLAVGLARKGHAVGLLDGDIYGPSLPTMLGLSAIEPVVIQGMIQPFAVHGLKAMTIGKLVDPEKPLIWRGPMAHGAFKQLTEQTQWGELDYLIIDLPPGTGDVSLTMAQMLRLTGAVVVCTPQKVAQDDAVRAARMFQQLGIEILGIVENMSTFIADDVSPAREYDLFGRGGAQLMAQRLGLPFLGELPITVKLRENSDKGDPTANFEPGTPLVGHLDGLVTNLENQVALASFKMGAKAPTLTIS
jgi:ATP-binding protein involved in chromosome partitioning